MDFFRGVDDFLAVGLFNAFRLSDPYKASFHFLNYCVSKLIPELGFTDWAHCFVFLEPEIKALKMVVVAASWEGNAFLFWVQIVKAHHALVEILPS